ncbi:Chitodextrinase [Pontiella desulfatans]|uniref:Chitodextrinase n=1 Tax=Pontiella desulfatans TaxID=2750659 RepID=A0A6C2UA20_PONDE|nr:Ig-like domain-containing protein [Pontiella desulfatans]VGO16234.1 Chitodextrinase [Pontiella desulfatans]
MRYNGITKCMLLTGCFVVASAQASIYFANWVGTGSTPGASSVQLSADGLTPTGNSYTWTIDHITDINEQFNISLTEADDRISRARLDLRNQGLLNGQGYLFNDVSGGNVWLTGSGTFLATQTSSTSPTMASSGDITDGAPAAPAGNRWTVNDGTGPEEINWILSGRESGAAFGDAGLLAWGFLWGDNDADGNISLNDTISLKYVLGADFFSELDTAEKLNAAIGISTPPIQPTVSLTSPADGAWVVPPADFTLAADVADADGTITQVEFFEGLNSLGVDTSSPYSVSWSGVPAGSYSLTAVATDNDSQSTISATVSVTVSVSIPSTSVTITAEDPTALERGVYPGTFRISRTGSIAADLTVNLTYSGNATSWDDYEPLPDTVTIPAGSTFVDLDVDPVNDPVDELDKSEDVIATVAGGAGYTVGSPATATVEITDDETFGITGPLITDVVIDSGTAVTLHWMDNHEDEELFTILYNGSSVSGIPADITSYQITGLTPGTKYTFTIKAEKDGGATESWTINGIGVWLMDGPGPAPSYRTFEQFRRFRGLDDSNRIVGGFSDNPDGDDKSNGWEYLFGSDPLEADNAGFGIEAAANNVQVSWPEHSDIADASLTLIESATLDAPLPSWAESPLASTYTNGTRTALDTRGDEVRFFALEASIHAPITPSTTLTAWGDSLTGNPGTWIEKLGEAPYNRTIQNNSIGGETSPHIRNRMIGLDVTSPFPAFDANTLVAGTPVRIVADRTRVPRIMEDSNQATGYSLTIANVSKVEFFNFGQKIGESTNPLQTSVTSGIALDPTRFIASGHPFSDGDLVHFTDENLPAPLDRYRPYIVRDADSGGFSLAAEDLVYEITAATDEFTSPSGYPAHSFVNGDVIRFTPAAAPIGFDGDPNIAYYVVNAEGDSFQLALTPGGTALTTHYNRTVRVQPMNGSVAALPAISLTEDFSGATAVTGPFVLNWAHPGGQTALSLRSYTDHDETTTLFFMGANNSRDATVILYHVREAVEHLKSMNSRFLVLTLPSSSAQIDGSGNQHVYSFAPQIVYNYWLRQTYPNHFVDARHALMRAYDPDDPDDVYYRDRDVVPDTMRSDPIHFNDAGQSVVAEAVWEKLQERGW